ncbi:acyl-CoA dehydrogenase family protein [Erythrobacter sp. YT30]|uniref:acyl-CoA dehydrogenase family protein n=1 Tax=Erythrobacter sp. YT30 TaxID=1735012 RepID=UPI000AFC8884|nr:acyl-CoA dehydrogenase [Erythrobacter sp. YT30]
MNFDLTDEQEMFRESVTRFAAPIDVEARRKLRLSPTGYDRERWESLAEMGLIALAVSEGSGGMGGSSVDLALVAEAIGASNSPDPWLELGVLPAFLLDRAGDPETAEAVVSGQQIISFAWAERAKRYDLEASHMAAEGSSDGFVLTGEKTFVMGALLADQFIVTAKCDGATTCFLVPRDAQGVEVRAYRLTDGSIAGELKLTRAVPSARLNLSRGDLDEIVGAMRLYAAAEMVGLGQRLLDDTLVYVKEREQFGVAIGSFQALQHRLVDCYAKIEQSRSMLYRAAMTDPADRAQFQRAAAGAKAFISEQVDFIAREAVQMHGGMGITDELAIGHAMKRVMVLARLFGDTDTVLAEYALAA